MKLEVWKDIEDYPNYQVSNLGRVKSKERYTKQRNGMNLRKENEIKSIVTKEQFESIKYSLEGECENI